MTIEIKVKCDVYGCANELQLDPYSMYNEEEQIKKVEWSVDSDRDNDSVKHYCKQCQENNGISGL